MYAAYPDAVRVQDKSGRSCLHLAVTAIQKIYTHKVVTAEDAEMFRLMDMQSAIKQSNKGRRGGNKASVESLKDEMAKLGVTIGKWRSASLVSTGSVGEEEGEEGGGEDEEEGEEGEGEGEEKEWKGAANAGPGGTAAAPATSTTNVNRQHIVQYIAQLHPDALCYLNKSAQTPLESILEGARPIVGATRSAKPPKGLIVTPTDDLQTARVLLLLQKRLSFTKGNKNLELKPRYINPLIELNWLARKDALFLSLECVVRPLIPGCTACSSTVKGKDAKKAKTATGVGKHKPLAKGKSSAKGAAATSSGGAGAGGGADSGVGGAPGTPTLTTFSRSNLLAKLRNRGQTDCIRVIIEYI